MKAHHSSAEAIGVGQAPLSYVQERLWFLSQVDPKNPAYNRPCALRLRGDLDVGVLEQCIHEMVRRHQILRSTFRLAGGGPVQLVHDTPAISIPVTDLTGLPSSQREAEAKRQAAQAGRELVDLSRGPLLKAKLFRLADQDHVLLILMHHIVTDAWSTQLIRRELSSLYDSFARCEPSPLAELPLQYGEFAAQQRKVITEASKSASLEYWKTHLLGAPPELEIYPDHPRSASRTFEGGQVSACISGDLLRGLRSLSREERATLQMTTLAAFAALLHRYTSQDDLVFGTFVAGRDRVELESLVGPFVNTIPLRIDLTGDPSFRELLQRVRRTCLEGYDHADLPFELLLAGMHLPRNPGRTPLFQVVFNYERFPGPGSESPVLTVEPFPFPRGLVNFDLTMELAVEPEGLNCDLQYDADLFAEARMQRSAAHYRRLLEAVVDEPDQRLVHIPLLSQDERDPILVRWNATRTEYPREASLHRLFEAQAERDPDRIAAEFGRERISYRDLNARANQLAHYLRRRGVGPGHIVAAGIEPSVDMMVVFLGILKAGGAYMPLTPLDPKDRTARILRDARAALVLGSSRLASTTPADVTEVVYYDVEWPSIEAEHTANLDGRVGPDNLACIIYTSGSTGEPKGVSIPHRAMVRLARETNYIHIEAEDRIGQASNVAFDAVSFEIWGALLNGACLVEIPRDIQLSPEAFVSHLQDKDISVLFLTTSLFNWLASHVPEGFRGLRCLMIGGEAADARWVREVLRAGPPRRLLNMYGPTESATFATWYEAREVDPRASTIPIGRPISNTVAFVLDRAMNPVPVGWPGEIYLGGDGLAQGYLASPQLTGERFVPNPFDEGGKSYLYRTGDWGRFREDGNIDFLGRKDEQVKILGFRVELGEIRAAISRHPAIQETVVIAVDGPDGVKRIVAYVVPKPGAHPRVQDLMDFLRSRVPTYMQPSNIVPLERLPVTASGKLDRAALPHAEMGPPPLEVEASRQPDELERQLQEVWEEVLGVCPSGIHDDFFELGGHSLLGAELCVRIEQALGRTLPIASLFAASTIAQQAELLRGGAAHVPGHGLPAMNLDGRMKPFFFVHGVGGQVIGYRELAKRLGPDQPVYGLQAEEGGFLGEGPTIERMADEYIRKMRMAEPTGPYLLGGHSFGGFVAFEMARQLSLQGERAMLVALIDTRASALSSYPSLLPVGKRLRHVAGTFANEVQFHVRGLRGLTWSKKLTYVMTRVGKRFRLSRAADKIGPVLDSLVPRTIQEAVEANLKALARYRPRPYEGKVTLFRARETHPVVYDKRFLGWKELALGGVELREVPGNHETIVLPPNLDLLVDELKSAIRAATTGEEDRNE